jgi:hypothetical protein
MKHDEQRMCHAMVLTRNVLALRRRVIVTRALFVLFFVFFLISYSHGAEHIVLYRLGEKDPGAWDQLRRLLGGKGYRITMVDGSDNIDKHVESINKINKLKASAFIAMNLGASDQNRVIVAVTVAKKAKGNILAIDEVPAFYANESRELATSLASVFNKGVKEIPLFPLLGVDMPGVYMKIEFTPDKASEVLEKFNEGLQQYFKRGRNDER